MDDRAIDAIFLGCLENLPPVSSKIVRIFTSSTFTDMSMERNALMEEVYPRIKDFCREKHGLEFQVVDMRWGVRDEATDDHMTTDLCMREIENCQRLSMGPNFVTFLGQKYGYRPIPTIIDGKEFRLIRDVLSLMSLDTSLLDRWYREDTNAVPSVFVLQPISSILVHFNNKRAPKLQAADQATWWDTLEKLQKLLRKAAHSLYVSEKIDHEAMHNYMMSVTEREVINGILKVSNTRNHCLAYIRQINAVDMTNLKEVSKFIDTLGRTVDIEAQRLLTDLRDVRLPAKIEASNMVKYTINWTGKEGLAVKYHEDYLREFTAHFYKHITRLVDRAMRKEDLSSQGHIVTEILQHLQAGKSSVSTFQGREYELNRIKSYIQSDCVQPFVLHGKGGSGKTSLLAKAASMVTTWCPKGTKPILILRFLGTTPDSSSVIPMLTSVCQQIMYNYMMPWEGIPDDLIPLIAFTKRLLTKITYEQALYIFLDSVDQLTGPSDSNKLTWLPTRIPDNVKIVISTASEGEAKEYHLLKKMLGNENQFVEVHPLGEELAEHTMKCWLQMNGRDLNKYQWNVVKKAISKCTLPIFIKLIFADVMRWRSYSKASETILAYTVMDSIMKLFDRIEKQHGRLLVAHALSYITASKSGLSETELEDLISLDDIVLDDVYQYHMPPVRRIPPLLWTRIRRDLPNYLSEREADGVSVLNWYHRQFRDAAIERYFVKPELVQYFHSSIAEYFLGTWGGGKPKPFKYTEIQRYRFGLKEQAGTADRKVPLQPLVFYTNDGRVSGYNKRKFGELPFHLVRSLRYEDLFENVLFNYMWLHSKISCCPLQTILADFEDMVEHLNDSELIKQLNIVADGMRLGGVVLAQHPDMLASQIIGRLLPVKDIYSRVKGLIVQCDNLGTQHCALVPAFHILHTPGGPLKYSLEGHPFAIFGFCLTSDQRFVLTVSNKFLMFDLMTGEITCDVDPEIPGIMQALALSADDKYAITYTNHNEIIILNALSGDVEIVTNMFESRPITGIDIYNNIGIAWTPKEWVTFHESNGEKLSVNSIEETEYFISHVHFLDEANYSIALSSHRKGKENLRANHLLRTTINGNSINELTIDSALYIVQESNDIYATQDFEDIYHVCHFKASTDGWNKVKDIGEIEIRVMALELSPDEHFLVGTTPVGFCLWNLATNKNVSLQLPSNVKNISTKPFHSQSSLALTKHNQYAVGGIRKSLYIWNLKDGQLLKEVDAHIARIMKIKSLIIDDFNGIVSSSIDKTIKVWNIKNIFEKVYTIDRMDMAIDAVTLSADDELAVTITRSSVGVWSVPTGKLWSKLVDSPVGAIVTHAVITADGRHVISSESGNLLIWSLRKGCVIFREKHANIKQLLLGIEDKIIIVITSESDKESKCSMRQVPSGELSYSFNFPCEVPSPAVITKNNVNLGLLSMDGIQKVVLVHNIKKGNFMFKIPLVSIQLLGFSGIFQFPGRASTIVIVSNDASWIVDIETKRLVRGIKRWNGACTRDGRYGLVAPNQGGLEMIELRNGKTVKVLIPPVSEGVFAVTAKFNRTDNYVLYYHSGRQTIRLFRVSNGKMIANYKLAAEASDFTTTHDGLSVVVGGVDGSFVVLAIADPENEESKQKLRNLPSRNDGNIRSLRSAVSFKTVANLTVTAAYTKRQSTCEESETSKVCCVS
ncbi:NACHT and WD repeat domain-containing protein 2-like [Stegodyphus dumicola]|uniref:NACHT and WD repeat domain-containing protein 2-like n=1 Tax=Stegodyphus dumicola TaxID=202533 RepID=UPI0015A78DEE|nr:NACHT and WD repeat domain-containing protein 2-like [Stegodyphus dumicola]